jgi:hypothetical protein
MSDRQAARELLRDLLQEALSVTNGHDSVRHAGAPDGAPPAVPAPPVAAVLRPSTWSAPPAPGEVIAGGPSEPAGAADTEWVALDSDEDVDRFVRALAARLEDPRERAAIREGRVRFARRRPGGHRTAVAGSAAGGVVRVERGAVTERKVDAAAKAGARLVLGPGAVLTPLAREKARARGIEIERER